MNVGLTYTVYILQAVSVDRIKYSLRWRLQLLFWPFSFGDRPFFCSLRSCGTGRGTPLTPRLEAVQENGLSDRVRFCG